MTTPVEMTIQKLRDLGFFQFILPYMLTAAIIYGALRKSKLFGEPDRNITVNGVIALVIAFMVWAYPIIAGVDVEAKLATFFAQGMAATLVIMLGLIISGLFLPPDLPKFIGDKIKSGKGLSVLLVVGGLIGFTVLITSGLVNIFLPQGFNLGGTGEDWTGVIVLAGLMVGSVALIAFMGGGFGGKKE